MSSRRAYRSDLSDARWALIEPVLSAWRQARAGVGLGLSEPVHNSREVSEASRHVGVVGAEGGFGDVQGALCEREGVAGPAQGVVVAREVSEAGRDAGVVGAEGGFGDVQGALFDGEGVAGAVIAGVNVRFSPKPACTVTDMQSMRCFARDRERDLVREPDRDRVGVPAELTGGLTSSGRSSRALPRAVQRRFRTGVCAANAVRPGWRCPLRACRRSRRGPVRRRPFGSPAPLCLEGHLPTTGRRAFGRTPTGRAGSAVRLARGR